MFTITPASIDCYQFPDDAQAGLVAILARFTGQVPETWVRAYAFTLQAMADDIVASAKEGTLYHVFLDLSEELTPVEKPFVTTFAAGLAGTKCDLTIGTSQAGRKYIMHQKGFTNTANDCWEGSLNFSNSAFLQVNSAMQFNDQTWREQFVASFNTDRAFAWANEASAQVMPEPVGGF